MEDTFSIWFLVDYFRTISILVVISAENGVKTMELRQVQY